MPSDHFSTQSADYSRFRPRYPDRLLDWLAEAAPARHLAWDCACGSGQATVALAGRFQRLIGTDLSAAQLSHAPALPNVDWRVATAENSGLAAGTADLITVAQALHWFDLARFWEEARRVAKPGGVIAVWSYGVFRCSNPPVQAVCDEYYHDIVGPYWPPERKIVEAGYDKLDFPFEELNAPAFAMTANWDTAQIAGYCASWSATERYRAERMDDPVPAFARRLSEAAGSEAMLRIEWPLSLRVGRILG